MSSAQAGPFADPDDLLLRHDVQFLVDTGVLKLSATTWPVSWPDVDAQLRALPVEALDALNSAARAAVRRLRWQVAQESTNHELRTHATLSAINERQAIRTFNAQARERLETTAQLEWLGDVLAFRLRATHANNAVDQKDYRLDGSYLSVLLGNWALGGGQIDRWWGPGWDSSLILSTNARPIPGLFLQRMRAVPFESKWLSWLGPWQFVVTLGVMEGHPRVIENPGFLGMRFAFRPLDGLEVGLTRTAQFAGEGRPHDVDTFLRLLIGQDNRGSRGVNVSNEPGNQLAGYDFRWNFTLAEQNVVLHTQLIGEDEAGGLPSRFIGQFGAEVAGAVPGFESFDAYRVWLEYADTALNFFEQDPIFNGAYNHDIYQTGYRYYNRSIGHTLDNDGRMASLGALLIGVDDTLWRLQLQFGEFNRDGNRPNSIAAGAEDFQRIQLGVDLPLTNSRLSIDLGMLRREPVGQDSEDDAFVGIRWHRALYNQ